MVGEKHQQPPGTLLQNLFNRFAGLTADSADGGDA
jgi:hypothetical protein